MTKVEDVHRSNIVFLALKGRSLISVCAQGLVALWNIKDVDSEDDSDQQFSLISLDRVPLEKGARVRHSAYDSDGEALLLNDSTHRKFILWCFEQKRVLRTFA